MADTDRINRMLTVRKARAADRTRLMTSSDMMMGSALEAWEA